jgi:hypothetical protein
MDLVFAHHELLDVVEMDHLTINPTAAFLKKDHRVKLLLSNKCFGQGLGRNMQLRVGSQSFLPGKFEVGYSY